MSMIEAAILGLVQGITEFLPVSSTGHLVLARLVFGSSGGDALAFDAILHLATAAAVVLYFFGDIRLLVHAAMRKLARLPVNPKDMTLLIALIVGTIPAVILGLALESWMETVFRNPLLVAGVLIVGSLLFMYAEIRYVAGKRDDHLTVRKGIMIGLFQTLALLPGMSRSGASIAGGMILGLSRTEAARFSFLLAIPLMLGAGTKKLFELMASSEPVSWSTVSIGSLIAFVTALAAIHFMLSFVRKYSLWPFIWYRIVLATLVVLVVWVT